MLRSAILHRKCKIAKLMCAQKPHCGYLHDAHIRPEGEGFSLGRSSAAGGDEGGNPSTVALSIHAASKTTLLRPLLSNTGKGFTCYAFFVAANFAFRTLRKRKAQQRAVAVLSAPRECAACGQEIAAEKGDF